MRAPGLGSMELKIPGKCLPDGASLVHLVLTGTLKRAAPGSRGYLVLNSGWGKPGLCIPCLLVP